MSSENETILLDDRNLVGEWKLDGNANDTSGNGYNGTATNVVYTKTDRGYQSQCGSFNGSSSKVDTTFPGLTNNFSVSIELTKGDSDGVAFSMHNAWCRIYSDGTVQANFYDGADRSISSSTGYVADSNLHHLVWVKTSTNGQALWLDGVKVAENTSHNGTLSTGYTGSPGIGYFRTFNAHYTSGQIQSVRIFNRALSATEIRNRYLESLRMLGGSSIHGLTDGLVSYLDSSDGNELSDIVGGKDGTKVSGTATTDNLGFTRAITNPNYTFPSITYTNVYSYENSGAGWGLVANPAGISATTINRTTTFRLALFFNRTLSASEQTAWASTLSKRYVLPFDVDGRKGLPRQLKANCKLWLTGDYSGTTAFDASGSGNNGTLVNSPTVTRGGLWGYKGLTFNGTNQYVNCGNPNITNTFTIFAIIYPKSFPFTTAGIIGGGASNGGIEFRLETSGQLGLIKQGIIAIDVNGGAVTLNKNQTVAVRYDGSNGNYDFFINGNKTKSGTNLQTFSHTNTIIGLGYYGLAGYFNGKISNPMIYGGTFLSDDKIRMLHQAFFTP